VGVLALTAVLTAVTFAVQPQVTANFKTWPMGYILPLLAVAGLAGVPVELHRKNQLNAFFASCVYLLGMLTRVVFGVYPHGAVGALPYFCSHGAERQGLRLRAEDRPDLVGHRHGPRHGVFRARLPFLRRQSSSATDGLAFGMAVYGRVSHALDENAENQI
jgi:hypothetical protein